MGNLGQPICGAHLQHEPVKFRYYDAYILPVTYSKEIIIHRCCVLDIYVGLSVGHINLYDNFLTNDGWV